jgi:iron complex outermembrane receptor protein
LDWVVGTMYYTSNGAFEHYHSGATTVVDSSGDTTAYGVFGEANYALTDRFSLIAGLRYSWEEKTFTSIRNNVVAPTVSESWDALTPRVTLQYDITKNTNVYFTYSTGFKSGVYNIAAAVLTPVDPETLTAYEVGIKSDPARWLRINTSLFHYDYEDLQVQARDTAGVTRLQNAGVVSIDGADVETTFKPTNELSFRLGVSYLDAEYDEFANAQVFNPLPAGGNVAAIEDVSGNTAMRSPKWTLKFGADYHHDVSFGTLGASLTVDYNSGFAMDVADRVKQDAFTMIGARAFWSAPDGSSRVTIFGDNLLNEEVVQYFSSSATGDLGAYRPPRWFGVRVSHDF